CRSCSRAAQLPLPFFSRSPAHRDLHSFPTRRSSDLHLRDRAAVRDLALDPLGDDLIVGQVALEVAVLGVGALVPAGLHGAEGGRSEEHTSELQSRFDLVCRLLLEKKKIRAKLVLFMR